MDLKSNQKFPTQCKDLLVEKHYAALIESTHYDSYGETSKFLHYVVLGNYQQALEWVVEKDNLIQAGYRQDVFKIISVEPVEIQRTVTFNLK